MQDEGKKCHKCGFINNVDAKKCIYCGIDLLEEHKKTKKINYWLFLFVGVIFLFIICAVFFFMK